MEMNKKELIDELRKINPLRTTNSFNKSSKEEIKQIYEEGVKVGAIKNGNGL